MYKFSFSKIDAVLEVPVSHEEELIFALVQDMSISVYLNRAFVNVCAFGGDDTVDTALEFNAHFNEWMKIYIVNCPKSVYLQIIRRDPETYAVCIRNKWCKNRYLPS